VSERVKYKFVERIVVTHNYNALIALVYAETKTFQQVLEVVYSNIWIPEIVRESSKPSGYAATAKAKQLYVLRR